MEGRHGRRLSKPSKHIPKKPKIFAYIRTKKYIEFSARITWTESVSSWLGIHCCFIRRSKYHSTIHIENVGKLPIWLLRIGYGRNSGWYIPHCAVHIFTESRESIYFKCSIYNECHPRANCLMSGKHSNIIEYRVLIYFIYGKF